MWFGFMVRGIRIRVRVRVKMMASVRVRVKVMVRVMVRLCPAKNKSPPSAPLGHAS